MSMTRPLSALGAGALLLGLFTVGAHAASNTPQAATATGTFVVTSTGDGADTANNGVCAAAGGGCTLRAALSEADAFAGPATIDFAIPGSGPFTISPATRLPLLTNTSGITVDGYSQSGSSRNTATYGSNAVLQIQLAGQGSSGIEGLYATNGANTFTGLSIYNFRHSIWLQGANTSHNQIVGDFICTNAAGTFKVTQVNGGAGGILAQDGTAYNTIGVAQSYNPANGLPALADRNIISGCAHRGVIISYEGSDFNRVMDNVVGLSPTGGPLPDQSHGIDVNYAAQDNQVGGPNPREGNVVSASAQEGIEISHGTFNRRNDVIGNCIGTDLTCTKLLSYTGNGMMGIRLEGQKDCDPCDPNAGYSNVYGNVVVGNQGGLLADKGQQYNQIHDNLIGVLPDGTPAGNALYGLRIEHGAVHNTVGPNNTIAYNQQGLQIDATESQPPSSYVYATPTNNITRNSIFGNGGLGIDEAPFNQPNVGTVHDPNVAGGIEAPVITGATQTTVTLTTCASCAVELYQSDEAAVSTSFTLANYGQGKTYLAAGTADSSGNVSIDVRALGLSPGEVLTADTTDAANNTSEFSKNVAVTTTTTATKSATALSIAPSAQSVPSGGSLTISGVLTVQNGAPIANEPIAVFGTTPSGTRTLIASGLVTDSGGNYSVTFSPSATMSYQAQFNGDPNYSFTRSPPTQQITVS